MAPFAAFRMVRYLSVGGAQKSSRPIQWHPGRPTGQVYAAPIEVRPHSAKWLRGRIRSGMPVVLPLSAIARNHLGNPGLYVCKSCDLRLGRAGRDRLKHDCLPRSPAVCRLRRIDCHRRLKFADEMKDRVLEWKRKNMVASLACGG